MDAAELLSKHLERFGRGDIEEILSEYAQDSVVFTGAGVFHGPDQLRPLYEMLFAEFGQPSVEFELLAQHAEGEFAYIAWKAETPQHSYTLGSDTFVVRGGKIVMQSAAVQATAKE